MQITHSQEQYYRPKESSKEHDEVNYDGVSSETI